MSNASIPEYHKSTGKSTSKSIAKSVPDSEIHELFHPVQNPVQIQFVLFRFRKSWNRSDVARLALISRARVTQIMDLLTLAPEIQEALLFLPLVYRGRDPIAERDVRSLLSELCWEQQRSVWNRFCSKQP